MDDSLTILFWNVHVKDLSADVGQLAHEQRADVVILAEAAEPDETIQRALQRATGRRFRALPNEVSRLSVFSTYATSELTTVSNGARFAGLRLLPVPGKEIGLFALHLPSKYQNEKDDLDLAAWQVVQSYKAFEKLLGHERTLVLGDFNMDPFEARMVRVHGFHAVLDSAIAGKRERSVQGQSYRFLYNPMWSRMGDSSPGPPGSYFYNKGKARTQFWHMFDQVLVRPDLIGALIADRVGIVDRIGRSSLLKDGKPDTERYSDHLPLRFSLSTSKVPR